MSIVRRIYSLVIFAAATWAIIATVLSILGEPVYFYPIQNMPGDDAPLHRMEVLRLTMFLTFAYFALLHIFLPNKNFSAGHVLITMMTVLTVLATITSVTQNFRFNEFGYLIAISLSGAAIFFASRPRIRRYFRRH